MGKPKKIDREEARKLWDSGWGLIDTCGRTRTHKEKSTIALASKKIRYTIMFKSKIKKEIYDKHLIKDSKEQFKTMLHCAGIYCC